MAPHNRGRRGRARKRRPAREVPPTAAGAAGAPGDGAPGSARAGAGAPGAPMGARPAPVRAGRRERARTRAAPRPGSLLTDRLAVGERPRAPWHPLPLSELLILVGAIGIVVGLARGLGGVAVLVAGLGAVLIGTVEVTLREHLSGYRSQTLILTALPSVLLFTGVVLVARPPVAVTLLLLVLDVVFAALLFRWLRARFVRARRARTYPAGR